MSERSGRKLRPLRLYQDLSSAKGARSVRHGGTKANLWGQCRISGLQGDASAPDKVVDELKTYDFEIISTNLPEEQEQQLREAFAHSG